jgi:hypothetical protein
LEGQQGVRDLFLESEAAEPVQANRAPALRAGLSRPIYVYDRKVGDFYATPDWVTKRFFVMSGSVIPQYH